ncbi:MAG: hypothetical protein IKF90_14580, partial [Parasporobacterium sp.]|nr:hypothetical protein [Parasporobacterium sp.]
VPFATKIAPKFIAGIPFAVSVYRLHNVDYKTGNCIFQERNCRSKTKESISCLNNSGTNLPHLSAEKVGGVHEEQFE